MPSKDNCGFYVFDYTQMDGSYGRQAFEAIYNSLRQSHGICAFNNGDISANTVRELATQASFVVPTTYISDSVSPLADLEGTFCFGAYLASIWTDTPHNIARTHEGLDKQEVPGYLGYLILSGHNEYEPFLRFVTQQLCLPLCIVLRDGQVVKGTASYGIGVRKVDTELLHAASFGDINAAVAAIKDGADLTCIAPSDRVSTPVIHAVCGQYTQMLELLLKCGADANADNGRNTALMLAARFGSEEMVRLLIDAGADVNAMDSHGGTALDNGCDFPNVVALLKSAGAV